MRLNERARNYCTQVTIEENLADAGFNEKEINIFMEYHRENKSGKEMKLLSKRRKDLLEILHDAERKISCLDFLVYRLQDKQDV